MIDVATLCEIKCLHLATFGPSLCRDQRVIQHVAGCVASCVAALNYLNSSFIAISEGALAASTSVDLGLNNDHVIVAEVGECGVDFEGSLSGVTARDGDSVFLKKAFSLILVYIHRL